MRRIGDVLLVTPLIRTFKHHWPDAQIDVLVFKGTESILANNKDIRTVISIEERPHFSSHCRLIKKIFRAYDLSISTLPNDKSTLYAFFAAHYRVGMLSEDKSRWWKSRLLSKAVEFDNLSTHTVVMNLRLAEILQLTPSLEIVLAWNEQDAARVANYIDVADQKMAVLHIMPKFSYKEWVLQGWLQLAHCLQMRGYTVVFSGGNTKQEKKIVSEILAHLKGNAINTVGCFSLSQLAFLLHHSQLYIGPDTVVTHMAAAVGIPTIALFGPTNPVKWGPWPKAWNSLSNPFVHKGSQQRNNVYLIQGVGGSCVPCFQEGCERHTKSRSRCLENLTAQQVIAVIQQLTDTVREPVAVS
ncbi:glycosyltransferase family 9 protein [Rickettsiella endosymbiont of Dermanyssus gallinae]|uniref:glycosyltransferase family 9 protein n=1 Tax=Rickettsiella endosymbiont of Dermanyssus gallinae TaxID=2856608 RepID=UPI001C531BE4|nr:glycosyltransferase family 9 protein [Rickettsiella endosymbiont of Dermanyssus gallinae]